MAVAAAVAAAARAADAAEGWRTHRSKMKVFPSRRSAVDCPVALLMMWGFADVRKMSLPASAIFATLMSGFRTGATWNVMFRACPSRVLEKRVFWPMFAMASPVALR